MNINKIKEELLEELDKQFPKGKCKERAGALMLYAKAVSLLELLTPTVNVEEIKEDFLYKFEGANLESMTESRSTRECMDIWNFFLPFIQSRNAVVEYGKPLSSFIQWKGTDLCMDWFCGHGHQNHWDGYFAYEIPCEICGEVYKLGDSVSLALKEGKEIK